MRLLSVIVFHLAFSAFAMNKEGPSQVDGNQFADSLIDSLSAILGSLQNINSSITAVRAGIKNGDQRKFIRVWEESTDQGPKEERENSSDEEKQ